MKQTVVLNRKANAVGATTKGDIIVKPKEIKKVADKVEPSGRLSRVEVITIDGSK